MEAITGRSLSKRHSLFPERLLSLWFYAYGSIFIITHANQGRGSQWAIPLCQDLWEATKSQQPNHFCTIWQRLQRLPEPLHNPSLPLCFVEQSTINHTHAVDWRGLRYTEHVWAKHSRLPSQSVNFARPLGQWSRLQPCYGKCGENDKQLKICLQH